MSMDKVFNSDSQHFISPITILSEFLQRGIEVMGRMHTKLSLPDPGDDFSTRFAAAAGISSAMAIGLADTCSIERCKTEDCLEADDQDPFLAGVPNVSLKTLEFQRVQIDKRNRDAQFKSVAQRNFKYDNYDFSAINRYSQVAKAVKEESATRYIANDIVITCTVLKPYNRPLDSHEIRLGRLFKADSTFLLCGNLLLTKLRDKIQCSADYAVDQDYSEDPDYKAGEADFSKEKYPSSFLFIHDTFFLDMRHPNAIDLSKEWANRRRDEVGPFHVADMDHVRVIDLQLRLGQPYLFLHQGSCEHLVVFTDLRLMERTDCQDVDNYPLAVQRKYPKRFACCACKVTTAKWTVLGNDRIPFEPAFFCDVCFKKFNYDKEGKKIGEFVAVPFFVRSALF